MNILSENNKYILVDVRATIYDGSYQILDKSDFNQSCGVYFNKDDAHAAYEALGTSYELWGGYYEIFTDTKPVSRLGNCRTDRLQG